MQARGVLADVVTCCSLINALERGGQWQLAEQLFVQMCAASWQAQGPDSPLYKLMLVAAEESQGMDKTAETVPGPHQAVAWNADNYSLPSPRTQSTERLGSSQYTSFGSPAQSTLSSPAKSRCPAPYSHAPEMQHHSSPLQSSVRGANNREGSSHPVERPSSLDQALSSDFQVPRREASQHSLFYQDPAHSVGRVASSSVTQAPLYHVCATPGSPATNSSRSLQTTPSSITSSGNLSGYVPKYLEKSPSLDCVRSGLISPARDPYARSPAESTLLQAFSNFRLDSTVPSVQRALFPQGQTPQAMGYGTPPGAPEGCSESTVRRIQEAAVNRQEVLSLRPMTNPEGGSMGQAAVLRHMNVSQIAPNRVCCNALLAAYARAKPPLWRKVTRPNKPCVVKYL